MSVTFKLRRGPAAEWTADNPVLASGEPGFETDTGKFKLGNGVLAWVDLPYFLDVPATTVLIQSLIDSDETPVVLTDAAVIESNYTSGKHFRVTLGGDRILGRPANLIAGRKVLWEFIQDATGNRDIVLDSVFNLGSDIQTVVLSTAGGKRDFMGTVYNEDDDSLDVIAFVRGY